MVACRDPGSTPVGEILRNVLLQRTEIMIDPVTEALIYMAARAALVAQVIRPAIAAGKPVVSDRFLLANVAYQGYGLELGGETIHQLGAVATQGILPDLTIVLDVDLETAARRRGKEGDRLEQRPRDFFQRVREGFLHEAGLRPDQVKIVHASGTVDEIHGEVRAHVASRFPELGGGR